MRPFYGPLVLALAFGTGALIGMVVNGVPTVVHATDPALAASPDKSTCSCPGIQDEAKPWPRPKFADASPPPLDTTDEMATLEALHMALSELGDGASYIWHQRNGRISGVINPTVSFKNSQGRVCRHVIMSLTAGSHSARTEGIACRMADKSWRLDG